MSIDFDLEGIDPENPYGFDYVNIFGEKMLPIYIKNTPKYLASRIISLTSFCSSALTQSQIVHIHFLPTWKGGECDMFFGSLAAIFDMFTPDELGVDLQTLYNARLIAGGFKFSTEKGA